MASVALHPGVQTSRDGAVAASATTGQAKHFSQPLPPIWDDGVYGYERVQTFKTKEKEFSLLLEISAH